MADRQPPQHQPLLPMHEEEKLPRKHRCCFCCCHLRGTVIWIQGEILCWWYVWLSTSLSIAYLTDLVWLILYSLLRYHVGDSLVGIISSRLLQDFMDFRSTDSTRSEHSILACFRNPRCRNVSYLFSPVCGLSRSCFLWHSHSQSSPIMVWIQWRRPSCDSWSHPLQCRTRISRGSLHSHRKYTYTNLPLSSVERVIQKLVVMHCLANHLRTVDLVSACCFCLWN